MKKLYIVHRWEGRPEKDWYQWLAQQLKDQFEVQVLAMPHPDEPKIEEWVEYLQKQVGSVDENVSFVGHSIGCQTILRFLEKQTGRADKVVFVTPWLTLTPVAVEGAEHIAQQWLETPIDWQNVKTKANAFFCIFSDNDPFVDLSNLDDFKDKLGAQTRVLSQKGHMSENDGIEMVPEVLEFLR